MVTTPTSLGRCTTRLTTPVTYPRVWTGEPRTRCLVSRIRFADAHPRIARLGFVLSVCTKLCSQIIFARHRHVLWTSFITSYMYVYVMQDQCGASYAFSAIGALEGAWSLAHGALTGLSEQNIIDCSGENLCHIFFRVNSTISIIDIYTQFLFCQCHMETTVAREGTCTIRSSILYPMTALTRPTPTHSRERFGS